MRKIASISLPVVKRFLGFFIVACFFLPLSQCTVKSDSSPELQQRVETSQEIVETKSFVPHQRIEFKNIDEIGLVLMFVWPLFTLFGALIYRNIYARNTIYAIELSASALGIFYVIQIFTLYPKILPAGYLLLVSLFLYFATAVVSIVRENQSLIMSNSR